MKAYCMKCKAQKEIKNPKNVKYGKHKAITGNCSKCGTKVSKFVKG